MIRKLITKINNFFDIELDHLPEDKYKKEYRISTVGTGRGGLPVLYTVYVKNDPGKDN